MDTTDFDTTELLNEPAVSRLSQLYGGISLTPTDAFESGLSIMDGKRQLLRLDKFLTDAAILQQMAVLSEQLVVAVDLPKNISLNGKYRFEKLRMHPLRQLPADQSRYADRLPTLIQGLVALNIKLVVFSGAQVRQAWQMQPPFRSRSSPYCKQMHATFRQELGITPLGAQLPAASLLDAITASMVAWSLFHGQAETHFQLESTNNWLGFPEGVPFYRALARVPIPTKSRFKRYHVRY